MLLRALSKCLLNADRLETSTASLGSLFQCLTTLLVKKCFLMSSLNLSWCSFEPFPCVLSLDPRGKSSAPRSPLPLLRKLQRAMRSPLSLLFSRLDKPKDLSCSSWELSHFLVGFEKGPGFCILVFPRLLPPPCGSVAGRITG